MFTYIAQEHDSPSQAEAIGQGVNDTDKTEIRATSVLLSHNAPPTPRSTTGITSK
jgi:hypothetical protein